MCFITIHIYIYIYVYVSPKAEPHNDQAETRGDGLKGEKHESNAQR